MRRYEMTTDIYDGICDHLCFYSAIICVKYQNIIQSTEHYSNALYCFLRLAAD